jgi:hypothetical protein
MASEKKAKVAKGAKPKDRRPSRVHRTGYGMIRRHRAKKGAGNRREAQHTVTGMLEQMPNKLWPPTVYPPPEGVTRGAFGRDAVKAFMATLPQTTS